VRLERLGKLKKSTSSGIRSCDLPACSIVPQPTTLPRTPSGRISYGIIYIYGLHTDIYVLQSIISWTGRMVALLCTTADTWSHEMVPCPFFSRPSEKQLRACVRACGVFRKKVTVVRERRKSRMS
jgi:hypothetical protein